jgi:hypothetical protein
LIKYSLKLRINTSMSHVLFPQLAHSQVIGRPMGGIPESAKGLRLSDVTVIAPDWLGCLAPQELACLKLRLSQLQAIFTPEKASPLSPDQQEVLKEVHALCEGVHHSQVNGLKAIFPLLVIEPSAFRRDLHVIINRDTMNTSELIRKINGILPLIFSGLQKSLKSQNKVSAEVFGQLFSSLEALFRAATPDTLRDPVQFQIHRRALALLQRCLASPDELFPILLRPLDPLEDYCRPDDLFSATSMTEPKRTLLLGAASLAESGLEQCIEKSTEAIRSLRSTLAQRALRDHSFPIDELERQQKLFLTTQLEAIRAMNFPQVTKQMVALEARAQRGDLEAIRELHRRLDRLGQDINRLHDTAANRAFVESWKAFKARLDEVQSSLRPRSKPLLDPAKEACESFGGHFDILVQDTHGFFGIMSDGCLKPAITDLSSTVAALESLQLRALPTKCRFIRHVDSLIHPLFHALTPIAQSAPEAEFPKMLEILGALSAFGHDLTLGMACLASSGLTPQINYLVTNLGKLTAELAEQLSDQPVDASAFQELAKWGTHQQKHGVSPGLPHLYPCLNLPIGDAEVLDEAALLFLQEGIKVLKLAIKDLETVLTQAEDDVIVPELRPYATALTRFMQSLSAHLSGPCTSEAEMKVLCQKLDREIEENFPTMPTHLLEKYIDELPSLLENMFNSIQFLIHVNMRPLLEIGRHISLTGTSTAAAAKPRRARRASPPRGAAQPPRAETSPASPVSALTTAGGAATSAEVSIRPAEAIALVRATAQRLPLRIGGSPSQERLYRNRNMEESALHLQRHLTNMAELLTDGASVIPRPYCDTLQRESALALESTLTYLMARYRVEYPEDKSLYQHQLDVMAGMVGPLELTANEVEFLHGLSSMLSNGSRPDQHQEDPRIGALLGRPTPSLATQDACTALRLVQKILGAEPLPTIAADVIESSDATAESKEVALCRTAHARLEEWHLEAPAISRMQFMHPHTHMMLRNRLIEHMLRDLPYHLSIIEPLMGRLSEAALTPCMMNGLLHHLGLLVEKSLKLSSFYEAIPSDSNPGMHAAFEMVCGRPRLYDHNLARNLELLPEAELSDRELGALTALSDHASFTRYPTQQRGTLPELLDRAALLTEIAEGFFHEDLISKAQKLFGPGSHNEWAAKAQEALHTLQTEELLPTALTLLAAAEKLLKRAHALRQ